MAQRVNLKITGLNTNPSQFGAREGSLKVAKNVNVDSPNTATSRRGFTKYGYDLDETGAGTYNAFFNYEDTIITHFGSGLFKDTGTDGGWDAFAGSYTAPDSEVKMRSVENNGSFFFTTDNGVYKLDDISNTPALSGIPRAIGFDMVLSGTSGFFTANTQVAYRVVWGKTDANKVVSLGYPSERGEIANVSSETGEYTETRDVQLTIYIPTGITTDYFFQVYRSGFSADQNTVANDELQLVYENNPTAAEIVAGSITFTDNTPDSLRGATIYTAPTQEGIGQANELPPLSVDMTMYKNYCLFANTKTRHRKVLVLLSVGGDSGVDVGDVITIGGVAFTAGIAQDHTTGTFEVALSGTAAENIRDTAKSLVQVINRYASNTVTYAYYTSGFDELPGEMLIERRDLTDSSFDITWDRASTGGNLGTMWNPPLSATPIASDNESKPNRVYISKFNQVDAVPILQYLDAGASNSAIKRILSLRDSTFILKDNGEIWRLTGTDINSFQLLLFDNTTKIIGARTAVVFNNQVFCFTEQGVVSISDSGVAVKSWDIEDKLKTFFADSDFATRAFAVSYESDRKYILYTGSGNNQENMLVYNSFTNSWTTWDTMAESAFINPTDDKMYLGKQDGYVYKERKNFDKFDFADDDYDVTISTYSGTSVYIRNTTVDVTAGQSLKQGDTSSYISAYQDGGTDYLVGTDGSLLSPDLQYDTPTNFIPCHDDLNKISVRLGTGEAIAATGSPGGTAAFTGSTSGSYGQLLFFQDPIATPQWDTFASADNNGVKTFTFSKSTDSDGLGGTFQYYYHKSAWEAAFLNVGSVNIIIDTSGAVYKDSVSGDNLVVDADGNVGLAGGGTYTGNIITVEDSTLWFADSATVNDFIDCELQWLEIYGDNPGYMKKFRELTAYFRQMNDKFTVKFNNNFDNVNTTTVEITPVSVGSDWGDGQWNAGPWGGTGQDNTEQRTYFPPDRMRSLWVNVMFETTRAFTQFSLNAVSMMYEMMDTEFTKAANV